MTPGMLMVPTSSHPTVPARVKFRGWWPLVDVCGALSRISAGVQRCCMLLLQHAKAACKIRNQTGARVASEAHASHTAAHHQHVRSAVPR